MNSGLRSKHHTACISLQRQWLIISCEGALPVRSWKNFENEGGSYMTQLSINCRVRGNCVWPTLGIYPTWWHAPEHGFPHEYLLLLPKNMYKGQREAFPKLASCVESDQNIKAHIMHSSLQPGLGCDLCNSSCASSHESLVYNSPCNRTRLSFIHFHRSLNGMRWKRMALSVIQTDHMTSTRNWWWKLGMV